MHFFLPSEVCQSVVLLSNSVRFFKHKGFFLYFWTHIQIKLLGRTFWRFSSLGMPNCIFIRSFAHLTCVYVFLQLCSIWVFDEVEASSTRNKKGGKGKEVKLYFSWYFVSILHKILADYRLGKASLLAFVIELPNSIIVREREGKEDLHRRLGWKEQRSRYEVLQLIS